MPIYEYRCGACGDLTEALQKVSEPPLTECPSCGEPALKRLISAPSFRLKGSGWYETDFKSDKEKKRNLAEAKEAGDRPEKTDKGDKQEKAGSSDDKPSKKSDDKSSSGKTEKKPDKGKGTEAA